MPTRWRPLVFIYSTRRLTVAVAVRLRIRRRAPREYQRMQRLKSKPLVVRSVHMLWCAAQLATCRCRYAVTCISSCVSAMQLLADGTPRYWSFQGLLPLANDDDVGDTVGTDADECDRHTLSCSQHSLQNADQLLDDVQPEPLRDEFACPRTRLTLPKAQQIVYYRPYQIHTFVTLFLPMH